jgi:hypothetical protein
MALGALLLGAATFVSPAHAQSCSDEVPVVHTSYPADGATGVPTNTPVYLYGPELGVGTHDVTLEDASGEGVMIDVVAVDGGLLVDPFLGVSPGTVYELTVAARAGGEEWSASFTTGTGPAPIVQLEAPDVGVSVIEREVTGCGVISAICVLGSVPERMTLEVLIGDEVLSIGGGQPEAAFPVEQGSIAANACIEVRVREPGGAVSEATEVCGAALGRFEQQANAAAPRSCQSYPAPARPAAQGGSGGAGGGSFDDLDEPDSESESGGCALGTSGAASGGGGLLLGLAALLAARQRRRSRV